MIQSIIQHQTTHLQPYFTNIHQVSIVPGKRLLNADLTNVWYDDGAEPRGRGRWRRWRRRRHGQFQPSRSLRPVALEAQLMCRL